VFSVDAMCSCLMCCIYSFSCSGGRTKGLLMHTSGNKASLLGVSKEGGGADDGHVRLEQLI
jgi:hypothetical protein